MHLFFETIAVAFSMFSALPMPQFEWRKENMRYALCAFPLIGAVTGLGIWGAAWFCSALAFPAVVRGGLFCLIPIAVTGGIHLDGYADTSDALAANTTPERRQEILKDSHCGAFAIIRLCSWLIAYFSLCCAFIPDRQAVFCMGCGFVLSRALSGFAVASFPMARDTGLAHTFASGADKKRVRIFLLILILLLAVLLCLSGGAAGAAMLFAAVCALVHYYRTATDKFGGISGDLAGWFLQKAELWMLAALILVQYGRVLP